MTQEKINDNKEARSILFHCASCLDYIFKFSDAVALAIAFLVALFVRSNIDVGTVVFGIIPEMAGATADPLSAESSQISFTIVALRYLIPSMFGLHIIYSLMDMYCGHRFLRRRLVFHKIISANLIMILCVSLVLYLRGNTWHPRGFFTFVFLLNAIVCQLLRSITSKFFVRHAKTHSEWRIPTVVVGNNDAASVICSMLDSKHPYGAYVAERLETPPNENTELVRKAIERSRARQLILADMNLTPREIMKYLDIASRDYNISTKILSHRFSVLGIRAGEPLEMILGVPLVHFESDSASDKSSVWRVVLSRTIAAFFCACSLPFFAAIALIIKLTSHGPVFFMQKRFGLNKRPFMMYKFRTMVADAETKQQEYEKENESGDGLFKIKHDPRITAVGRILRRYSLDELPQIFNVVKGDMRFVGPRPLPGRDVSHYYEAWHSYRHFGEPGLTCLWQVSGRSEVGFEDMCLLDVYYLHNRSWILDVKIILRTIGVVISGRGAY